MKAGDKSTIPTEYALYPAYPNPTFQQTMIVYDIPAAGDVAISIIDSTQTVLKRLVQTHLEAGSYFTYWDRTDTVGVEVSPGYYRVVMTADSFECHGDVRLLARDPQSDSITVIATTNGTTATIRYSSDVPVGALQLTLFFDDQIQDPNFHVTMHDMITYFQRDRNMMRILITPDISDLHVLPAGSNVQVCVMSYTGNVMPAYADASNETGTAIMKTIIRHFRL